MQYQPTKAKTLIFLILSVAIFFTLFLLGTFYDLQISQLLTANSLSNGEYYTDDSFALCFKTIGSAPIWLALGVAFILVAVMTAKSNFRPWLKWTTSILAGVASWIVLKEMTTDVFKFALQPLYLQDLLQTTQIKITVAFFATLVWLLLLYCCKNCKNDQKVWRFVLVIISSCVLFVVVSLIKTPFGRVRFRTLNVLQDTTLYTPWYKINGSRTFDGLPYDCCKSFPSGHTFSAGMVFLLLCLPDLVDFAQKRWTRITLWITTFSYVFAVALSRIIAGAHYLTDVTFSFGLALFGVLFFRELFLTNFTNVKILFRSKDNNEKL